MVRLAEIIEIKSSTGLFMYLLLARRCAAVCTYHLKRMSVISKLVSYSAGLLNELSTKSQGNLTCVLP